MEENPVASPERRAPAPALPEPIAQDATRRDSIPKQKIVALRVISPPGGARFSGEGLRNALEREGLSFGRYNIFHRELEDNQVLFSVASLVEPGSFDLAEMSTREYPGVSLFAVLPGPFVGTRVFDEMLSAGRHLASKLGGQLQDDKRQPLTGQKVMDLRESVEAFDLRLQSPRREGGA
jgi:cell division protein ZipA